MKKQAAGSEKAFFSKSGTSCNIQASCEDVPWEWWDTDFSSIRQETENSDIPFMWCRVHRNVLWMNGNINGYSSRSPDEFEKMIEECKQKASIKSK